MATTSKEEMFSKFQPWVLATYGDSAKTKTITLRKAARIRALLSSNDKVKHHRRKLMRWLVEVVLLGSCSRLVELFRQIRLSLMLTWISIILSYIETIIILCRLLCPYILFLWLTNYTSVATLAMFPAQTGRNITIPFKALLGQFNAHQILRWPVMPGAEALRFFLFGLQPTSGWRGRWCSIQ